MSSAKQLWQQSDAVYAAPNKTPRSEHVELEHSIRKPGTSAKMRVVDVFCGVGVPSGCVILRCL